MPPFLPRGTAPGFRWFCAPLVRARYLGDVVDGVPPRRAMLCEGHRMADRDPIQPTYVRLPAELHQAVKERSAAEERTMAQTIRVALRYYLNTTEPLAGT